MSNIFKRLALLTASAAVGLACGLPVVAFINAVFGADEARLGLSFIAGFALCFAGIACYALVDVGPFVLVSAPRKARTGRTRPRWSMNWSWDWLPRWPEAPASAMSAVGPRRWVDSSFPSANSGIGWSWSRDQAARSGLEVNPASGLTMLPGGSVDVAGNPLGMNNTDWTGGIDLGRSMLSSDHTS